MSSAVVGGVTVSTGSMNYSFVPGRRGHPDRQIERTRNQQVLRTMHSGWQLNGQLSQGCGPVPC